jgi:hypothetical protein
LEKSEMTEKRKPGRPIGSTKEPTTIVLIRLTAQRRIRFKELGGSRWVNRLIDESTKPAPNNP